MFESDYLGNEQARLAKHKSGYIFPIIYKVIMTDDGQNYICNFKQDNSYKNCAFIICFKDGLICDISSSVLTYFNYDALTVKNNKINIHDIIPEALQDKKYQRKAGKTFAYKDSQFNCVIEPVKFELELAQDDAEDINYSYEVAGYLIKCELVTDKN